MSLGATSTCPRGAERWERFESTVLGRSLVQYEYRTPAGCLFTTVRRTLRDCRAARDEWLQTQATEGRE